MSLIVKPATFILKFLTSFSVHVYLVIFHKIIRSGSLCTSGRSVRIMSSNYSAYVLHLGKDVVHLKSMENNGYVDFHLLELYS